MTILEQLHHRLVVSVQAYPGEPMRDPDTMNRIAQAAVLGGAAGIRAQGLADIELIARTVTVPVIGLWKDGADGVFITPTLRHAVAVADAGADVVALDGTRRPRPDGLTFARTLALLRDHTDALVMADCGSLDDAIAAADAGADVIGTTLAGYTGERPKSDGPDFELLDELVARVALPVMVEGRVHTPAQAAAALARGAYSVCVGTAITHPTTITSWFVTAIGGEASAATH